MIVVPTHNGYWALNRLIDAIEQYGSDGHKIIIMDNGTTDLVSKKYLQELSSSDNYRVERSETSWGYEAGALVNAIRLYPEEEKALLIQDSCVPTSDQWIKQFEDKLTPEVGAVNWIRFRPCLFWCTQPYLDYIDIVCGGHDNVPEGGFFGNIFYCYTSAIKEFDRKGYFENLPTQKLHSECWERNWPILFHLEGYKTECIIDQFCPTSIHHGYYPHLKKLFSGRE